MFIKFKMSAIFIILIAGAAYWLYGSSSDFFSSEDEISENAFFATNGSIRRKLLALNSNENEYSLEFKPHSITSYKEKLNDEKINVSKNLFSYNKLRDHRVKKLSRRKREIHHNNVGWKLNLNVTNNKNSPLAVSNLSSVNDLISTSGKGKFLNMAVQMEGASPDNSFKELHHSWDSLGLLLRRLYGKHASFKDNARDNPVETSTEPNDFVQSDIPQEKPERERTPKLIFGFFNPKSSENPLEGVVTTHRNDDSSESVTSPKMNTILKEGPISTIVPLSLNTTDEPMEAFGLKKSISVESTIVPITETFMGFESTNSEFNTKFEKTSDSPDRDFPFQITTIKPKNSFTSQQLKEFCISLLSRIHAPPKSVDNFSEDEGSGEPNIISLGNTESMNESPSLSTEPSEEVTTKSTNQIVGIWASIWNRFAGRRMEQQSSEVNMQLSTLTAEHIAPEKASNNGDDVLSLKSESSTNLDDSDSTESDFFDDEDESALTVPDCEHFFRHMQNDAIFSKPNLLDIINNPILLNLHPSEFNFTEIRDDKQMRSMRSGSDSTGSNDENNFLITEETVNNLKTTFSSVISPVKEVTDEISENDLFREQLDKIEFNVTVTSQDALLTSSFIDDKETFQNKEIDKPNIDNFIAVKENNVATEMVLLSDKFTTVQTKKSTLILDDRSTSQSDIQARTDKTSETSSVKVSTDIDPRIFGVLNFGSGERSLEDLDILTTEITSDFPENRSFPPDLTSFSNLDSDLNEAFTNTLQITSTDSASKPNIFDVILSLRKQESQTNVTESDAFVIKEQNGTTEGGSKIIFVENPSNERQFDKEENLTENHNILDLTSKPPTQPILDDQMPFQKGFDETTQIEFQFKHEEFTESQNFNLNSTRLLIAPSLSEAPTPFQNVLEDGNGDKGSRIFPGLLNVFGSGDGREISDVSIDPELTSEFSECLDCNKNKSSHFSIDDCIDCESKVNDTVPFIVEDISTEINSLLKEIAPVASTYAIDYDNQVNAFSESNGKRLESSTHSLEKLTSSQITGLIGPEIHDTSENIGYEGHEKSSTENIGYDVYKHYYIYETTGYGVHGNDHNSENDYGKHENHNTENNGYDGHEYNYEITNYEEYENQDNGENHGYDGYEYGYENTNYEGYENHDNTENNGYDGYENPYSNENISYGLYDHPDNTENIGYAYRHHNDYENTNYEVPEYHDNSETYGYEVTSLEHSHVEGKINESHSNIKTEAFSASPTEEDTIDSKDPRFIDTLFLIGSGAGGLFGNDNGEINLVQEPDTTSFSFPVSPRQSRRGGRRDDIPFDQTWPTEKKEHVSKNQFPIQSHDGSENLELNTLDARQDGKVMTPEEAEKLNIVTKSFWTTFRSIHGLDGFNHPNFSEYTTQPFQDVPKKTVTAISIPASSFVIPKKKAKDLPPKYCNHAGECNIALNEGCITKKGHGVCDCRRSFVRDPETDICEAPFMLKTSLKLPGETFHRDLRDKYSELYHNKTRDAIDTMWLVVYQDPTLEENIADIQVAGFEKGSLVVHWELIFAVKNNESISEIIREVDDKLKETFKHHVVLQSAPLNVENAKLLSVSSDINPCEIKELNYCSKYADCIKDEYRGFRCRCKRGYLDNSKHPIYPGEICIATCPPDFCGENGYCEVRFNGEKQCLCNGWYFGEKCNVSGILIISCFAGANCVLIAVVLAIVCCCKRRRRRRARFYENNQIMFQPSQQMNQFGQVSPRLGASIALDELGPAKPSKYMAISTPLNMVPDIRITSPSILGSSISYDYDSTFDRTPSAEIDMEPPKYDAVPEVPKYDSVPKV